MNSTGPPDSATLAVDHHDKQQQQRLHEEEPEEHTGMDNPAFQDNGDVLASHDGVDSAAVVLGSHGGLADLRLDGEIKDKEVAEAVNLELVNMNPNNGSGNGIGLNGIPVKKEPGEDTSEGYADPYDEYFVPVNEHRKYMRGEKLYVTKDKRRSQSWGRLILMGICCVVVAAAIVIGALAATGVILSQQEAIVGDAAITSRQFSGSASPVLEAGSNDVFPEEVSSYSPPPLISHEPETPPSTEMNQYYVPRVLDGEFIIDDMEFNPELSRPDSNQFQMLAASLEEELKNALFDYQSLHYGAADISTKVLQFSPGSVVVKFRIGWLFKSGLRNPPDPIQKDDVRRRLENHLQEHNGYLGKYHLPTASIRAGYVIDMCQFNNGQCSNDCIFNYHTLDFVCSCPSGQVLDATGKNCTVEDREPENEIQEQPEGKVDRVHYNTELQSPEHRSHTEVPIPEPQPNTEVPVEPRHSAEMPVPEPQPNQEMPAPEPQPNTELPAPEPLPNTEIPVEPRHSAEMPAPEPQPNTELPAPEPQPDTELPAPEPQPNTELPAPEPQPNTELPVPEPQPNTELPAPEPQPNTELPVPEPQPNTELPVPEPQPNTELPAPEPQPNTELPAPEPQPNTELPAPEPQPITELPASEPLPNTGMPVLERQASTEMPILVHQASTEMPAPEPQPNTEELPTPEPQPNTEELPAPEPQPITELPASEPLPSTVMPIHEHQASTEMRAPEPQPNTEEMPAPEPQPNTEEIPAPEPQPNTEELPAPEPPSDHNIPAPELQPNTDAIVPAAEPQPSTDAPATEPEPSTDIPAAEPIPNTESSLSKPLSSTEIPENESGTSTNSSHFEVLSNTELIQMGLQPVLPLEHEHNESSEVEMLPATEIANEVPTGREIGQFHASMTEHQQDLSVTSRNLESETNNVLHSMFHTESHTEHILPNDSKSTVIDSDVTNTENNKSTEITTKIFGGHDYENSVTEHNSSEIAKSEIPTTEVHKSFVNNEETKNSENNTETHPNENELDIDYRIDLTDQDDVVNYLPHPSSEMPASEVQEITTNVKGIPELMSTTEQLPFTTEVFQSVEKTSEDSSQAYVDPNVKLPFNMTNEVQGRQKLSRMESGDENLPSNDMQSDVNAILNSSLSDIGANRNITSDVLQADDENEQLENNIDEYGINETQQSHEVKVGEAAVYSNEELSSNRSENNFKSADSSMAENSTTTASENSEEGLVPSAQNNTALDSDEDDGVPERKPHHEIDPMSELMHTLLSGAHDSGEALNDTTRNETSTEFDEKFRNIVEEPGFVLVNLTRENDVPKPVSVANNSYDVTEELTEVPVRELGNTTLGSKVAVESTMDELQNNATHPIAAPEDSENHIKDTLSLEEDKHQFLGVEHSHNVSVSSKDNVKKYPRLDGDEMSMANPHEKNQTHEKDVDEIIPSAQPAMDSDNSNIDDTTVQNISKVNETLLKDKNVVKDETGPSNDILSDQAAEISSSTEKNKINNSSTEIITSANQNGGSGIAGVNVSSVENDIDDIWNDLSNMTEQNSTHVYDNSSYSPESRHPTQNNVSADTEHYRISTQLNTSITHEVPTNSNETVAENDLIPLVMTSDMEDHGLDEPLAVIPLEKTQENYSTRTNEEEMLPAEVNASVYSVKENVSEFTETHKLTIKVNPDTVAATNETETDSPNTVNVTHSDESAANSLINLPVNNLAKSENFTDDRGVTASTGPENINIVSQPGISSVGSDTSYIIGSSKEVTEQKVQGSGNITSTGENLHQFLSEDLENKLVNHVDSNQESHASADHFGEVLRIPPSTDGNSIPPTSHGVSQEGVESIVKDTMAVNASMNQRESPIDETELTDKANSELLIDKTEVKKKDLSSTGNSKKTNKSTDIGSSADEEASAGKLTNGIFDKKGKYDKDQNKKIEKLGLQDAKEDSLNSSNLALESKNVTEKIEDLPKIPEEPSAVDVQDENENALHVISDTIEDINTVNEGDVNESKKEKKKSDKISTKEVANDKILKPLVVDVNNSSFSNGPVELAMSENMDNTTGQEKVGLAMPNASSEQSFNYSENNSGISATTLAKENVIDNQPSVNGGPERLPANGEQPHLLNAQTLKLEEENSMQDSTSTNMNSSSANSLTEHSTEPLSKDTDDLEMATRLDDTVVKTVSTMPTITANDFTKLLEDVGIIQMMNGSTQDASVTFSKCAAGQFQCNNGTSRDGAYCVSLSAKCDSVNDCSDGSDEVGCVEEGCPGNFQCASGQCLKRHLVCNGIVDCNDNSDEVDCDKWKCLFDEFQCPSGRCIPVLWQCDGKPDCGNHTDEYNCQSTCGNDEFLCPELWCIPMTWRCNGHPECANGEDEKLCDCTVDQFKCHTGGCVQQSQVCDGVEHCPDSSDEWDCLKIQKDTESLQIRSSEGSWHSVCGDRWDGNVSDLVCRELGYGKAVDTDLTPLIQGNSTNVYYMLKPGSEAVQPGRQPSPLTMITPTSECSSGSNVEISCQEFSCGSFSSADGMAARLVGGDKASSNQWPSVALMYHTAHKSSCTASIISPVWLLTSYSCLKSKDKTMLPDAWVVFGGGSMFEQGKLERQIREVQAIIPHPQIKFNQFVYSNNLALVRLANPLMFTRYVSAVCLPEEEIEPRQLCVTAGWSYAAPGELNFSPYLNYLPVPTIELDICNSTKHFAGYIESSDICAGFMDFRKTPCYNDEGAPLMCVNEGGVWELQGVLSYHGTCGRGDHPAIFSSVSSSRDWIERTVGTHFEHKTAFNIRRR